MGLFHKPLPVQASNATGPVRGHLPKTAPKELQRAKVGRQVRVRQRRSIQARHVGLVAADPVVLECFDQLQTAWRHQKIKNLVAPIRRDLMLQRERDKERKAWLRLADYLSNRRERLDNRR